MYKIIGNRLIKEKVVETPKQIAVIRTDIEVVENPNNETLEIDVLPEKPQETDSHYVVMTFNNDILAYELRERPKPTEKKVDELENRTSATEDALLALIMGGVM